MKSRKQSGDKNKETKKQTTITKKPKNINPIKSMKCS